MSEMKKCPFCGGEADYTQILGNYGRVYCFTCDGGIREGRSKDGVIHNWNSRPIEDALNARIAELKDVMEIVYDEWITCDDDWWTEEVDELKEKAARILKNLPEVQE